MVRREQGAWNDGKKFTAVITLLRGLADVGCERECSPPVSLRPGVVALG